MQVERIAETQFSNIYGIYENNGQPIGTAELKIAGREAGKIYFYSLSGRYTRKQIATIYKANRK